MFWADYSGFSRNLRDLRRMVPVNDFLLIGRLCLFDGHVSGFSRLAVARCQRCFARFRSSRSNSVICRQSPIFWGCCFSSPCFRRRMVITAAICPSGKLGFRQRISCLSGCDCSPKTHATLFGKACPNAGCTVWLQWRSIAGRAVAA